MSKSLKTTIDNSIKSDASKYDKKSQREHILLRPGMYIGDVEPVTESMWIYKDEKISKENIKFSPGFFKIFDEILVNARDAHENDATCDTVKVDYNIDEGYISIYNNGDEGIPVEEHPVHKTVVPSMIFGELLTSSNYDDNKERTTGGTNGLGSKVANIFSTKFIVEIDDAKRKKRFRQVWENNMETVNPAEITKLPAKTKSSVKITFYPDFKRFHIDDLNNSHYYLFHRRCVDLSGTSNKLKVYFNEEKVNVSNFKQYIELYYPGETVYYDSPNERWEVGVLYKQDAGNEVISFVNSISTYHGGTHCNHVIDNIIKVLINDYIKKKDKDIKITPTILKDNLVFFVNSIIVNPAFSSQTKDILTTKADKFGSKYEPSETFLKKVAKCGIVEQVIELIKFKEKSSLKKTDGKKQVKIIGIPKLEDANKAGTKDSYKCTLILTEGDSAKATAMSGLAIVGQDYYGVFPLKGKMLNVREASPSQLLDNEEIKNLKTIIGLKQGADYSSDEAFNTLRYGHVLLLTDSDVDGSHIKGLFMNMLHSLWPSLIKRNTFIQSLNTPIVKATCKKDVIAFYNLTDYDNWKNNPESKKYSIKYYKGLGTSTSLESREYFTDIHSKLINYLWSSDEHCNDAMTLAFEKSRADDRKEWLMEYDKNNILKYEDREISYYDFVNSDLIHFSNEDLNRSIPCVIDGLKPSQRKILYGAILRGLDKDEVKVAQLAGFVSDKASYHHGEASLMGAIIGMAQNHVGSNNINILQPNGQFGTRNENGKDSASPRYIWTKLEKLSTIIFNSDDTPILNHQTDDGLPIEPEYYGPIVPMILINGAEGIGTGFSTKIPPYNPLDVINNLKLLIKGKELNQLEPWWQKFEGTVKKIDNYNYEIYGNWEIKNNKLIITELPVGEATSSYKAFLEKMLDDEPSKTKTIKAKVKKENPLISYTSNNTDTKVYFELTFQDEYLDKFNDSNIYDLLKLMHLVKKYSITNMHLYNSKGTIQKYDNVEDIMRDYYVVRLELYQKRKDYQLEILEHQLELISWKVKFILMVIEKKLEINNKKRDAIEEALVKNKFPKLGINKDAKPSYDYLLSMPIYNLTFEKIEELKKQLDDKQTEYDELKDKSINKIWLEELNLLAEEYKVFYQNKLDEMESSTTNKNSSKRKSKKN